uniref:PhzF family phenazine biosynthesis protein n=1 Tax=Haptolina ericina TaxID=156174 RepID=A0A7S3APR9_9EUKA|mmetsp:Transcript_26280/g.59606  ORF Transcript_26280/g.59606 Transcript_26280/m.59606 type:complete len:101 (+) Transcript_26280:1-303(+)
MDANVVATAAADVAADGEEQFDFISRWFGPLSGIPEDPVTGSAHSTLAPFWSERLGKRSMVARQASQRGGTLRLTMDGNRVLISGPAAFYMEGQVMLPTG